MLAPNTTDSSSLVVGIDTTSAGDKSGTATISLASNGNGSSNLGITPLTSQTVDVTGKVYRLAVANAHTPDPVAFGIVHLNDVVAKQAVSLTNGATNDIYSERLDASFGSPTTGVTTNGGSITQLLPGSTDSTSLKVGISTVAAGSINGSVSLALQSDGANTSGLGLTDLTAQIVHVTGQVNYYADPLLAFKSGSGTLTETDATHFTLDLGVSGARHRQLFRVLWRGQRAPRRHVPGYARRHVRYHWRDQLRPHRFRRLLGDRTRERAGSTSEFQQRDVGGPLHQQPFPQPHEHQHEQLLLAWRH